MMGKKTRKILLWAYLAIANSLVAHIPLNGIRCFLYKKLFLVKLGQGSCIHMGCWIMKPREIEIGSHSIINARCTLDGRMGLRIGNNVDIASETVILTLGHDVQASDYRTKGAPVVIGDRACIYTRAMILPGVEIGEGAVVAAGSVVNKNVPPFTIVAGVPAKPIGKRTEVLDYTLEVTRYFY